MVAAYRRLQAALQAGDDLAGSALALDMISTQTDHLLEHKLRLDATAPPPQQT